MIATTTHSNGELARVAVVGTSGCGKSTFARQLAAILAVPHVELDQLYWGPNWTNRPAAEFCAAIDAATAEPAWVCDGNYHPVRDLVWQRATTIVWLDYSFPVVFGRVLRRTLRRSLTREQIFGGNRESLRLAFFSRESILLWVLKTFWQRRREYPLLLAEPAYTHLNRVNFARPAEAESWLKAVANRRGGGSADFSSSGSTLRVSGPAC